MLVVHQGPADQNRSAMVGCPFRVQVLSASVVQSHQVSRAGIFRFWSHLNEIIFPMRKVLQTFF